MMNALYLKDLAEKTKRGMLGRVEDGKSGGGLCYGYRVAGWTGSVLFTALYAAFLYNWRDPHLRLTVPPLNYLALGLAQAIPFLVAIVLVLLSRRWWSRLMVATLCLRVVAIALLIGSVASCCAVEYRHGTDRSFERLRAVPTRFGRLVVYRINGGVMTSYGIHRQSIWRPSRDRENCAASTVSRNRDSVRTRHCLVRQISEAGQRHGPDDQRRITPEVRPFRLN